MKKILDDLLVNLHNASDLHPYIVIILMHEITRLLFPKDPFIESPPEYNHQLNQLEDAIKKSNDILNSFKKIGSYKLDFSNSEKRSDDIRDEVSDVYGKVWRNNDKKMVLDAKKIIEERFTNNSIDLNIIKDKKVLDLGCGSGRFTVALGLLGAKEIIGVDWGDDGLAKGRELATAFGVQAEFLKMDILDLEFEDKSFDFIYCNGVTHHSESMEIATKELIRVLKDDGSSWYYVYGAGGLFWEILLKFNALMKKVNIPKEYAMEVLKTIGMPENRHIFLDHWYVPILKNTTKENFEKMLSNAGFGEYKRVTIARDTDPDQLVIKKDINDIAMWGDGDCNLRYMVKK